MNRKLIIRVLGAILAIEGLAMIPAFLVSLYYRDGDTAALGYSIIITLVVGVCMLSGMFTHFDSAFFESVSGFTTTGASVFEGFENYMHGVVFWRATTHWIGGMGVLVLTLALLPKLAGRTAHLVKAESPGPSLSKLVPKT